MKATLMLWLSLVVSVSAEPHSKPYIPFRTNPQDHPFVKHKINWNDERSNTRRSNVREYNVVKEHADKEKCPLQFTLGVSRRAHHKAQNSEAFSIVTPPVIHPVFPARGPGRQLVHTTLYEHLDLLSPEVAGSEGSGRSSSIIKEGLIQHQDFPLLFESSSFAYTSPIIHDVNGDGIPDAIISDYDGGIYIVGLHQGKESKRWFHKAQVPRIFIRRSWIEARVNETYKELHPDAPQEAEELKDDNGAIRDPYHSYFEYSASNYGQKEVLRGVTANVLGQKRNDLDALHQRRIRLPAGFGDSEDLEEESTEDKGEEAIEEQQHRRLQEVDKKQEKDEETSSPRRRLLEVEVPEDDAALQVSFPRRRLQEVEEEERRRREEEETKIREQREREEQQRREEEERRQQEENQRRADEERRRQEDEQRRIDDERRRQEDEQRRLEDERRVQEDEAKRAQDQDAERQRREEEARRAQEQDAEKQRQEEEARRAQEAERQRQEEEAQRAQGAEKQRQEEEARRNQEAERQRQEEEARKAQENAEQQQPDQQGEGEEKEEPDEGSHSVSTSREDDVVGEDAGPRGDDEYPSKPRGDDAYRYGYGDDMGPTGGYDDYYGRYRSYRDDFYDEKHYVRINPHILSTPTLAEIPKMYGNEDEVEEVLFVPVSYFLDEDEYEGHLSYKRFENTDTGDETEVQRGMYVASAIMIYQLNKDPRWGRQEHLDLSSDHSAPQNTTLLGRIPVSEDNTKMGAFALSRPAVADIDGDGKLEILVATSMGLVYAFDATHMTMKNNWPIQMQHAVETPIIVEDLAANSKLEVIVSDIGGNVACFDEDGNKFWHRDLRAAVSDGLSSVRASSPMVVGDVDGDGKMDIVIALQVLLNSKEATYVFALNGANGEDLPNFPLGFDTPASLRLKHNEDWIHQQLPAPLLVDLHEDQSHIQDYIRRNGTAWQRRERSKPGGGTAPGLHVVMPVGETLYIIEAGSGCILNFGVGEEMFAMVQADDVHGTNNLDLVLSTTSGNIITMESSSPYHPLNVWNNGEMRGRLNNYAHGYSASQGIFVHSVSREYRDIFGVFVPVTFEIFDNRPNIQFEPDKRHYKVEIRDGTSAKRAIWRNSYNHTGVFTERLYIPHGAGYYALTVQMRTTNGILYEDMFHIGYNVNYMDGFGLMLWLPLLLAAITIFLGSSRNVKWDDDDYENRDRNGAGLGILG